MTDGSTDGFDVFVSYGHGDRPWVRVIAENLERAGLHVLYDEWDILAGDVLVHRLDTGIRESRAGILVVSPHALSQPWVAAEYGAMLSQAVDGGQRLISVLLADADLPPFLCRLTKDRPGRATSRDYYDSHVDHLPMIVATVAPRA